MASGRRKRYAFSAEKVRIKKLRQEAVIPSYATEFSAGADLCAAVSEPFTVKPHETAKVPTGLSFEIPEGLAGLVFARSGLASKRGLAPANKVGVIDSDYRGEVFVTLHNHGTEPQEILPWERIAQIAFVPYVKADFECADDLTETVRGDGGFGSTGRV